jgi:hypothetical protein
MDGFEVLLGKCFMTMAHVAQIPHLYSLLTFDDPKVHVFSKVRRQWGVISRITTMRTIISTHHRAVQPSKGYDGSLEESK